MQLDTRSRLFEFLAHGLVSWKWEIFIIDLFEGAEMQIVASLSSKSTICIRGLFPANCTELFRAADCELFVILVLRKCHEFSSE